MAETIRSKPDSQIWYENGYEKGVATAAEQFRVDLTLARNECARLREVIDRVSEIAERPTTDFTLAGELRRLVKLKFPREVKVAQ